MLKEGKLAYIKGTTLPSASDATVEGDKLKESIGMSFDGKGKKDS